MQQVFKVYSEEENEHNQLERRRFSKDEVVQLALLSGNIRVEKDYAHIHFVDDTGKKKRLHLINRGNSYWRQRDKRKNIIDCIDDVFRYT